MTTDGEIVASREGEEEPSVRVGDILKVSDQDTGFSTEAKSRWCMVTRIFGQNVRVAGRSASSTEGVAVPASAMDAFDRAGVFFRPGARISLSLALNCENVGQLPDPYRVQVLFYLNEDMP
jgi:hypothetical protein